MAAYQPRAHRRFQIAVRVTRYGNVIDEWRTVNLSEGGMFVGAVTAALPGTTLDIGICLDRPGEHAEVVADAEVVWRNNPDDGGYDPELPNGLGLRFVDLDEEDREVLRRFLNHANQEVVQQALPALRDVPGLPELPELPRPPATPAGLEAPNAAGAPLAAEMAADLEPPASEDRAAGRAPTAFNKAETEVVGTNLLAAGTVLGSYRIDGVLGKGGMGTVYLAEHTRVGRQVALKKLHQKYTEDPTAVGRFFDEAHLAAQIRHEHIADVTDFVSEGDHHYIVMELLHGVTLAEEIAKHGTLPLARAIRIALQLCDVLQAVHDAGIIHRDLKPENILLVERNGDPDFVKLLDFGIARLREPGAAERRTKSGQVVGTPGYIAPEHVLGAPLDHRVDIYAFGVVLYKMLVGNMPFEAECFDELVVKQATEQAPNLAAMLSMPVPPEIEAIAVECLDRDPQIRPQSMRDIAERLAESNKALWAPEQETLEAPRPTEEPTKTKRFRSWAGVLLLVSLLAAAAGGAWLASRLAGKDEAQQRSGDVTEVPPQRPRGRHRAAVRPGARTETEPQGETVGNGAAVEPQPTTPGKKARAKKAKRKRRHRRVEDDSPAQPADTVQTRFDRGVEYLRAQKAVLAVQELEAVVAAAPRHADAYRALGKAYALLGRNTAAIDAYENYLRLRPTARDAGRLRQLIDAQRKGGAAQ